MTKGTSIEKVATGQFIDPDIWNQTIENAGTEGGLRPFDTGGAVDTDGVQDIGDDDDYPFGHIRVSQDKSYKVINPSTGSVVSEVSHPFLVNFQRLLSTGFEGDGDDSASSFASMGGEYQFGTFTIDANITVDDTIGWLIIRADTIVVSNSGGATVDGEGESIKAGSGGTAGATSSGTSAASSDTEAGYGIAGQAGTGGSGGRSDGTGATGNTGACKLWYGPTNLGQISGTSGVSGGSGDTAGNNGNSATDIDVRLGPNLLFNPINFGQGGTGGTGGVDDGVASSFGGNGGRGGAGIIILCNTLTMTEDLTLNANGEDGADGVETTGEAAGGGGGGGGAGSVLLAYNTTSGSGNITMTSVGGTGGTGPAGPGKAGNGGSGGDGVTVEIDIKASTMTVT